MNSILLKITDSSVQAAKLMSSLKKIPYDDRSQHQILNN